jgi:hypothetical protein
MIMRHTMAYHIDGRIQVEIRCETRCENASWAVVQTAPAARARLHDALRSAGLQEDDMTLFLDALVEESVQRHH